MDQPIYSFIYDRSTADVAFHGIAVPQLVLSLLAGITPEASWKECLVFEGPSPHEGATVCIGTSGPGADALQLRLVEELEKQGVRIIAVYEGGPSPQIQIAVERDGRWSSP